MHLTPHKTKETLEKRLNKRGNRMKKVLTILLVIVLLGVAIGGFFIYRYVSSTIGKDAAVQIALKDAGLERNQAYDLNVE